MENEIIINGSKVEFEEYEIIQNAILGAHVLYEFVSYFSQSSSSGKGVRMPYCFPILPIVFNREYTKEIYARRFSKGSFIKVVTSSKIIFDDLQKRMEDMAPTTFRSLNIAVDAKLLLLDSSSGRITINEKRNIQYSSSSIKDYQKIISASRRLGYWFSQLDDKTILDSLNIKF